MPGGSSGPAETAIQRHLRSTARGEFNNQEITTLLAGLLNSTLDRCAFLRYNTHINKKELYAETNSKTHCTN
jgi:hypothetical protein